MANKRARVLFFCTFLLVVFMFECRGFAQRTFRQDQLKYGRVRTAIKEKESVLLNLFKEKHLKYPPDRIFIRVFKDERILELWSLSDKEVAFQLVKSYPICSLSGTLGPKRRQGDLQIPEGFYYIDRFNPASSFYLSLGINYPNKSDRILGVKGKLGGDIFIHGDCVTIGCVPITNNLIKELYLAAVEAKSNGQKQIPVHIFPTKMDQEGMATLRNDFQDDPGLISFWENLKIGHDFFENKLKPPSILVDKAGKYRFSNPSGAKAWKKVDKGLHLGKFDAPRKSFIGNHLIVVLKVDPTFFSFKLLSASEHGGKPRTVKRWCDEFGMLAAINASMYLGDNKTSTGYMKNYSHINHGFINPKFGAFLAFNPRTASTPPVQIVDRHNQKNWEKLIKKYNTVIQNYRMISLNGNNVWKQSDEVYSAAAVAMDKDGDVLFILCRSPYSVYDLNKILLQLPLNIKNAMYVEGGPEASLYLNANKKEHEWMGSYETDFTEHDNNNSAWVVPNVIGIAKRALPE